MFGRHQRTRAPAPTQQYRRITDTQLANHMEKRLANAEKVKEKGPKLASRAFQPGDRVVVQDPISKLWETHGQITEKISRRRYHVRADAGHKLMRNGKFIRLTSQTGPGPNTMGQANRPQPERGPGSNTMAQVHPPPPEPPEDNAPPGEVVATSYNEPARRPATVPARRESSKRKRKKPQRYLD